MERRKFIMVGGGVVAAAAVGAASSRLGESRRCTKARDRAERRGPAIYRLSRGRDRMYSTVSRRLMASMTMATADP